MCLRANRGECQHAVCHECHEKRSKSHKRSRGCILSEDELMKSCHHELRNLQLCADMWWCTKDHLGGPQWFDRPKGCAFCERMFNVGDKWMWIFCVRKIHGLSPVSWTSELRVQQIEHLWYMDGQWRMESGYFCHSILQTVEDVFLSFVWYLNRLMKTCSLCIIWEAWVVWLSLWHCRSYKKSFVVFGLGGMVKKRMAIWHAWQNL